jgi:hypothetical protein
VGERVLQLDLEAVWQPTLIGSVRYRRERHRALEAWRRGETVSLAEPDWEIARA